MAAIGGRVVPGPEGWVEHGWVKGERIPERTWVGDGQLPNKFQLRWAFAKTIFLL